MLEPKQQRSRAKNLLAVTLANVLVLGWLGAAPAVANTEEPDTDNGVVIGRVLGSNGAPLASAGVELYTYDPTDESQPNNYWPEYDTADTETDGTFIFEDLPAGQYKLRIDEEAPNEDEGTFGHPEMYYANQYSLATATVFTVTDNGTVNLGDLRLPTGGTVTGRVLGYANQTLADQTVDLIKYDFFEQEWLEDELTEYTDAKGRFSLTGLSAGQYKLRVHEGNNHRGEYYDNQDTLAKATTFTVSVTGTVALRDIALTPKKVTATFTRVKAPKRVAAGKKAKVSLTVKSAAITTGAQVTLKLGKKTVTKAKVASKGKATLTINTKKLKLKKGKTYRFTVQYQGNPATKKSKTKTIKIKIT